MILVNAIYLKADWEIKFDSKETAKKEFHTQNKGTIKVISLKIILKFALIISLIRFLPGNFDKIRNRY